MKTIGLIGGLSWESTVDYYRIINRETNNRLGNKHSAKILMYSFDFDEIDKRLQENNWEAIGSRLVEEAVRLQNAGAEMIVLCANTAHKWAGMVQGNIQVPLIHIADATGESVRKSGIKTVALLGTKYTMEETYIKKKLSSDYNLNVVIPLPDSRKIIHDIIYDELILGIFNDSSTMKILAIIQQFEKVDGIILGCTELPLIINQENCNYPLFNTTELHAKAIVDFALQ